MRIGVISEGHADRAVIINILTGLTGLDETDIKPLRPIYNYDETDKASINPETFSSWSVVRNECQKRELIDGFLAFEDQDFVVIHIDTAEAESYGIQRPDKNTETYCKDLRALVIKQIDAWLNQNMSNQILYAVAIEETEAWILTIYDPKDSIKSAKPKEKLNKILSKKGINSTSTYDNFIKISKPLSKRRDIHKGKFLIYNCSLNAFFEEIKTKVLPKLENN